MKIIRTDFDRLHDYGCLINPRIIYFGSERHDEETGDEEKGVEYASTKKVIKNLLFLDTLNHKQITLYLNNPGGCEFNGMAIYDIIKKIKSPVKAIGIGQVMSMASIILQACKYRWLTENTTVMIHDGSFSMDSDSKSFEKWGKWSEKFRKKMYKIYYNKMKKKNKKITLAQVEEMCSHDQILSAFQAVGFGLADKVIGSKEDLK